jgi:hypothetical protein
MTSIKSKPITIPTNKSTENVNYNISDSFDYKNYNFSVPKYSFSPSYQNESFISRNFRYSNSKHDPNIPLPPNKDPIKKELIDELLEKFMKK